MFLEETIAEIESEIITEYSVVVMTLGALSDTRMEKWGSNPQKPVTTVLIDEAGQMIHSASLVPLRLEPKRVTIIGDDFQLKPVVISFAAQFVGFQKSMMEWIRCAS